jgi:tetratricopeptide (TPR) repeat protein
VLPGAVGVEMNPPLHVRLAQDRCPVLPRLFIRFRVKSIRHHRPFACGRRHPLAPDHGHFPGLELGAGHDFRGSLDIDEPVTGQGGGDLVRRARRRRRPQGGQIALFAGATRGQQRHSRNPNSPLQYPIRKHPCIERHGRSASQDARRLRNTLAQLDTAPLAAAVARLQGVEHEADIKHFQRDSAWRRAASEGPLALLWFGGGGKRHTQNGVHLGTVIGREWRAAPSAPGCGAWAQDPLPAWRGYRRLTLRLTPGTSQRDAPTFQGERRDAPPRIKPSNLQLHRRVALFRFADMFWTNRVLRVCASLAAAVALCGCLPASQSPMDEQKEMHFLTGKARVREQDNEGAIEAFERALEVNPGNASAHFELGILYEKVNDYAAAIYHFERFLKLRPDSGHAAVLRDRISTDKVELSKTAAFAPVTKQLQEEFYKLAEEDRQVRAEAEKWRAEAERWRAYYNSRSQAPVAGSTTEPPQPARVLTGAPDAAAPGPAARSHTVKSGDTLTSIASRYGVSLSALQSANPGIEPRRMRPGDVLRVPGN